MFVLKGIFIGISVIGNLPTARFKAEQIQNSVCLGIIDLIKNILWKS